MGTREYRFPARKTISLKDELELWAGILKRKIGARVQYQDRMWQVYSAAIWITCDGGPQRSMTILSEIRSALEKGDHWRMKEIEKVKEYSPPREHQLTLRSFLRTAEGFQALSKSEVFREWAKSKREAAKVPEPKGTHTNEKSLDCLQKMASPPSESSNIKQETPDGMSEETSDQLPF